MFELTDKAKRLSKQSNIEPQLILEIDGIPYKYGTVAVKKLARYGEDDIKYGDSGLVYGGVVIDPNSRAYISQQGTTKNITQQLLQDQGGTSSISRFKIALVDVNGEVSEAINSGNFVSDILSTKANVYLNFSQGAHPEDSIRIFSGNIDDVEYMPGMVLLAIAHPENLKRREVFQQIQTALTAAIDDTVTTIPVESTAGSILPGDVVTTYIRIDDEVIKYTSLTDTSYTSCTRAQFGTIAASHDDEADVTTIYQVIERPIQLSLKMMLSGPDTYFLTGEQISRFVVDDPANFIDNAIFFDTSSISRDYGLVPGDKITVSGAANGANNFTDRTILSIFNRDEGSYLIVNGAALVVENLGTSAVADFGSKYNTLPDGAGLGLNPDQVDVEQFEEIDSLTFSLFPTYDFRLNESINAKDFIDKELFYPAGMYSLPRKGKISAGVTFPPLYGGDTPIIDTANVKNPTQIKIKRSVNKDFYNAVVYRYSPDILEDKFRAGVIFQSADSTARIVNVGNKTFTINSKGLRKDPTTDNLLKTNSRRLLERYQFAAERLDNVELLYGDGFALEVGDVIPFGSPDLQLTDTTTGTKDFQPRNMEIVNKSLDIFKGSVKISLLDTNFANDAVFGTISGSSLVDTGATTSSIPIKRSFSTTEFQLERDKWDKFIGEQIQVRAPDYSEYNTTTLTAIQGIESAKLIVDPPLSFTPQSDYIVDLTPYNDTSFDINSLSKRVHVFFDPQVNVTSGASNTVFDVDDATPLFIGAAVRIHNDAFTDDSGDTKITNIVGNTITVEDDMGFTPAVDYRVSLIGFEDSGKPYRII